MSTAIDERIVAAKFDASDFEKGVNKTIKKLDELKKNLDFKEATKGVKELAEKTEVSTDSMSKSLEKLTDRFTNFAGMIKQKILSGLAQEVANVFLKMEQSVTGFIRSISSDQVSAGMSKYEQMLTSVRVMMSAGKDEEASYKAIERLQTYSDETSYSLSQMTDAMSKMVASGVELEDATKNVEGIANACANAGINAQDASRAFFNLSQAYSSGVLHYTDYRSLELLNLTTEEFKRSMLQSAEAAGTLKKIGDDMWQTINTNDKKVTAGKKVTLKNLNEMLRYNFMNTAAMNSLFGGTYWMEVIGRDELEKTKKEFKKLYGDNWEVELKKKYGAIAVEAFEAAKEARNFTDVINALKDAVSTGWATTFEHLFGKLSDAAEFFTDLSNSELANVIYKIGDYRNAVLGYWDDLDPEGRGSGGEVLRQSLLNIAEALGTLLRTFQQILPGFDELDYAEDKQQPILEGIGDKLFELTMNFREFSKRIKKAAEDFNAFMNSGIGGEGPTRIEIIRQAIANLSSVFGIIGKVVSIAFNTISKVFYTLRPVFDGFIQLLEKVTAPLVGFKENKEVFNSIEDSINNILTVLKPVAEVIGTILGFLGEVGAFIAQMALDTVVSNITFFSDVLGIIIELITGNSSQMERGEGVLDRIRKDFEGIKNACTEGLGAIKNFFGALISDIRTLLGLSDGTETDSTNQNGGIFANLTNFFNTNEFVQKAKAWVSQAIIDVGDFIKSIPERVKRFGANIYDTLRGLFFTEQTRYNGSTLETKTVLTPLGEWLAGVIENIKNFIISIPQRIIDGIGKLGNWVDEVFNSLFGEGSAKPTDKSKSNVEKSEDAAMSAFDEFVKGIIESVRNWFDDLPNKIQAGLKSIGDFFSKVYEKIDEFLFGKKLVYGKAVKNDKGGYDYKTFTKRYKTGFSKFLDGVVQEVQKFIKNIPEYIKSAIKGAGDIISVIVNALFGKDPNDKTADSKDVEEKLKQPFLGIDISGILTTIKDIGVTILNQIARIFTGTDDIEANQEWFSNIIANGIKWIREKAQIAFDWVIDFISTLPIKIKNIFSGDNAKEQGPVGKAISDFGSAIGGFIASLPETISTFLTNALKEIGNVWDTIYQHLIGNMEDSSKKTTDEAAKATYPDALQGHHTRKAKSKWESFVESLGKLISTAFEELPKWIAEGIRLAVAKINELIGSLTEWLKGENVAREMEEAAKEAMKNAEQGTANVAKETTEASVKGAGDSMKDAEKQAESPLLTAIKGIGQSLYTLITATLPAFISEGWKWVVSKGSIVWDAITGLFDDYQASDFAKTVNGIGEKIKTAILNLPQTISDAFKTVSEFVRNLFAGSPPVDLSSVPEAERKHVEEYINKMQKDTHGLSIIDSFKQFFNSIFGEDGILSGDVGQKVLDFFTKTIPKLIGKAIGALINEIPKIYKSFSDGLLESASAESKNTANKAEEEAANVTDATVRISNAFGNILEIFTRGLETGQVQDAALIIVRLIAIIEVLKAVRDIISTINVSKNLAEKAENTNSFTAAMKRIATAIMAAFAFVAYLTMIDDEKRKDAMEVVKDLTHLFELFIQLTTVGSAIGNVTSTITSVSNDIRAIKNPLVEMSRIGTTADKATKGFGKVKEALSGSVGTVVKTAGITAAGEMIQYGLEDIIGSVVDVFERLANGLKTVSGYISDTVGILIKIKDDIKSAIDVANDSVTLVQTMSGLSEFRDEISTIEEFMPTLTGSLSLFKTSVSGRWIKATEITSSIRDLMGMTDQMKEFAKFSEEDTFEQFKFALASLGAALSMYTGNGDLSKITSSTGISAVVTVLNEILGSEEVDSLAEQLSVDKFPSASKMYSTAEKLVIFAGAIASISGASKDITDDAGENLQRLFYAVSKISLPKDTEDVSDIASKFGTLGNALGSFANDTSTLTTDKLKTVEIAIDMMTQLSRSLKGTGQSFLEKVFEGDEGIDEFGTKLSLFGTKLRQFFDAVGGGEEATFNINNINIALTAIRALSVAYQHLTENNTFDFLKSSWENLGNGLVGSNGKKGFVDHFKDFLTVLQAITITGDELSNILKMTDIINALADVAVKGTGQNANTELEEMANQLNLTNQSGIGRAMIDFFNGIKNLEVNEDAISIFESFGKTLEALANIASLGLSTRSGGIAAGKTLFDDLTSAFGYFNTQFDSMKQFFVNVKEFDQEGIEAAKTLFESLKDFGASLYYFSVGDVDKGLENLKWFDWDNLASVLSDNLYGAFDAKKDAFTSTGNILAKSLYEGIQNAFDTDPDLQVKITPIFKIDEATKQQFNNAFGNRSFNVGEIARFTMGANNQVDQDRIDSVTLYTKIDAITSAVDGLAGKQVSISDVTNAFAGMQIVTDTGVLVGEITDRLDDALGRKIILIERGLTV